MSGPPLAALLYVGGLDESRASGALSRLDLEVSHPVDPTMFPRERLAVAVLDPAALGLAAPSQLAVITAGLAGTPVVVLAGPCARDTLIDWIAVPEVHAVVARDHFRSDDDLEHALDAIVRGPGFGLDVHVPARANRFETRLAASTDREQVLEQLAAFLGEQRVRQRVIRAAVTAAEELITNAVYDAPTDVAGQRLYAEIDRRSAIFLGEAARPTVRAAVDGSEVVVAVHDPHGSLSIATARRYLVKGLRAGPDQIDEKRGGAGLGLARVFAMVDRMAIHLRPGVETEVTFGISQLGARSDMSARPTGLVLASA